MRATEGVTTCAVHMPFFYNHILKSMRFFFCMVIRIATWNIYSGKPWQEIADVIQDLHIDIIGLQEVDSELERTGYRDIAASIAERIGYHHVFAPSMERTIDGRTPGFGNAVVSRYPILESRRHFLGSPDGWMRPAHGFLSSEQDLHADARTQPRTLLETLIRPLDTQIRFMTTHLAYSREFASTRTRRRQMATILRLVRQPTNCVQVLAGDFNAQPENPEILRARRFFLEMDPFHHLKTWPLQSFSYKGWNVPPGPTYKIDYIFLTPHTCAGVAYTHETPFSDHALVYGDIGIDTRP